MEKSEWQGDEIVSEEVKVLVTTQVGPRVISLRFKGGENLFYEMKEEGGGDYRHYGGHRLWTTPEDISYTYHVENSPVIKDQSGWYYSSPDPRGIQKSFKIEEVQGGFRVSHRLVNAGSSEVLTSPWGITMLRGGGYGFFPDEPPKAHGSNSFLPVRSLALWSYTKMNDPRLTFGDGITRVEHRAGLGPFKIGAYVSLGWGGYYRQGVVFLKVFNGAEDSYPDRGSNFEIYTDENLLETETTGTMRLLKSGDLHTCSEIWQIFECEENNLVSVCTAKAESVRHLL